MSGFAGRGSGDRHFNQINKAFRQGRVSHRKTNTLVVYEGDARQLSTFEGPRWIVSGRMCFYHYDVKVLEMDFDGDRVSDFGYMGYSLTTSKNIDRWWYGLRRLNLMDLQTFDAGWPFIWTAKKCSGEGHAAEMFDRFRKGVPWAPNVGGDLWYEGTKYDAGLYHLYERLKTEVMGDGVSWHWFTADWDARGRWSKRFIDKAAETRWNIWMRKKAP